MKKVDVIMSSYLNSGIGPVQTIKRIVKNYDYFKQNGYEITAFTLDNLPVPAYTEIKHKNTSLIKSLKKLAQKFARNSKTYARFRIDLMFKESHRILDYYKSLDRKPDMIVFHSLMDIHEYLLHYRISGVKLGLFTHSDGMMFKMLLSYFPKLVGTDFEIELLRKADFIMDNVDVKPCIAKIEEINLLANHPQLKGKTILVENGIEDLPKDQLEELAEIKSRKYSKKYRLVSAGSLNGRKGQREVLEALHAIPRELLKDISVDFIGDGPERKELERLVSDWSLESVVTFKGYIPNVEVYKYIGECNIYILISKLEGLPLSILEALRGGIGVISTNVSGIPEIVDSTNGVLIEPNVKELTEVFKHLGNYNWAQMGENSRKKFDEHYCFERMKSDYLKMLNKVEF